MQYLKLAVFSIALGSTGAWAEECTAPDAIESFPDGSVATLEEMVASQQELKAFQAANKEYMECMNSMAMAAEEAANEDGEVTEEESAAVSALNLKHDQAVDVETEMADKFNTERLEYLDKNPQ